ncbi:unnamed protein product [Diabrotica balteata]|uniref:Uncharacterized protein n=2 Tax=Diabrotica balteata TaxID=107213 RepID=A0A9N9X771_DIABA|nr:unnamed protein product [Diabrotica balteata]
MTEGVTKKRDETCTLKKADKNKLDAFEMWVYRRIVKDRLLKQIQQRYLQYFGHIARRTGTMKKLIVEGRVEGKRPRGRSSSRWVDQTKTLINQGLHEAEQLARDREGWRGILKKL